MEIALKQLKAVEAISSVNECGLSPASVAVQNVFSLLEAQTVRYCLTHGYQGLPRSWGSDIDILVDRSVTPEALYTILKRHEAQLGATVVYRDGMRLVLCCKTPQSMPQLIVLDFFHDLWIGRCLFFKGESLLAGRRKLRGFWVPSAAAAFEIDLAKGLSKKNCGPDLAFRLADLFVASSQDIQANLQKRWPQGVASQIITAAETGKWDRVWAEPRRLWRQVAFLRAKNTPQQTMLAFIHGIRDRIARVVHPRGRHIVLLGPDGAGKSSTIEAMVESLTPLFSRIEVKGFAPSLRQLLGRAGGNTSAPHGLPPRSVPASMLRTVYWLVYALASHVSLRWNRIRSDLVLNDRHFIDILVDPVRYRYSGPSWPLKLVWHLTPRPDLLILLSGEPEVIQARKRELSVAETTRLCQAYEDLVGPLAYGCTIDSGMPRDQMVEKVLAAAIETLKH